MKYITRAALTSLFIFGCSKAPEYHLADFNRDGVEDRAYFLDEDLKVSFGKEDGSFRDSRIVVSRKELEETGGTKDFEFKVGDVTEDKIPDLYFERHNRLGGPSRIVIPNKRGWYFFAARVG